MSLYYLCSVYHYIVTLLHINTSGLKLMVQYKDEPFIAFTYALTSVTERINPVKKKVLVTEAVQGDHVFVYTLEEGDNLAEMVLDCRGQSAKAVVLINTCEDYSVDPVYLKGLERSTFPLIVVKHTDGQSLLKNLDRADGNDVMCDIDVESGVDLPDTLSRQNPLQRAGSSRESAPTTGTVLHLYTAS